MEDMKQKWSPQGAYRKRMGHILKEHVIPSMSFLKCQHIYLNLKG